jgi:hypothetical protein
LTRTLTFASASFIQPFRNRECDLTRNSAFKRLTPTSVHAGRDRPKMLRYGVPIASTFPGSYPTT